MRDRCSRRCFSASGRPPHRHPPPFTTAWRAPSTRSARASSNRKVRKQSTTGRRLCLSRMSRKTTSAQRAQRSPSRSSSRGLFSGSLKSWRSLDGTRRILPLSRSSSSTSWFARLEHLEESIGRAASLTQGEQRLRLPRSCGRSRVRRSEGERLYPWSIRIAKRLIFSSRSSDPRGSFAPDLGHRRPVAPRLLCDNQSRLCPGDGSTIGFLKGLEPGPMAELEPSEVKRLRTPQKRQPGAGPPPV